MNKYAFEPQIEYGSYKPAVELNSTRNLHCATTTILTRIASSLQTVQGSSSL